MSALHPEADISVACGAHSCAFMSRVFVAGELESTPLARVKSLNNLERAMGIEPTTRSLGSYCSTTELHPPCNVS